MNQFDTLENQSIYALREAFSRFERVWLLWSVGKHSTALLWLARKAFFGYVPFPVVHIDTSYKIPGIGDFRDRLARDCNLTLVISRNEEVLRADRTFPTA